MKVSLKVPTTRNAWALYDMVGASAAAASMGKLLREKLTKALAEDRTGMAAAGKIRDEMYLEMNLHRKLGARDSEPACILVETIEKAFGIHTGDLER